MLDKWLPDRKFKYPIILHDNARPHKSKLIKQYFKDENIRTWNHPPYSPDISPPDFNCFGILKRKLKENFYDNWHELEIHLETVIRELNEKGFMNGIQKLPERWRNLIDAEGSYL